MNRPVPALALAGFTALGGLSHVAAQVAPLPDTLHGPGSAVPYVAQGPLLCGGAAAAMIQRFWGEIGVYAEDYSGHVDREAGGIYTDDLARALVRRGYAVEVIRDDAEAALARARSGQPVVTLLASGRSRYHYVVVVAAGADQVRYHDPLRGPDRELSSGPPTGSGSRPSVSPGAAAIGSSPPGWRQADRRGFRPPDRVPTPRPGAAPGPLPGPTGVAA